VEEQRATVTKRATIFNELLPVIPLWERYGNNPALDGERVKGWLPAGDPIYQNSPYEDSFTVIMLMDGTLKEMGSSAPPCASPPASQPGQRPSSLCSGMEKG
jgi:hypothetical protein